MKRKYGSLQSPRDLRDFRVCSNNTKIELPSEFNLNHGIIKDQGSVNSCVAHALSSMLEQKENNVFSTGWIYGYRPQGYYQGEGMYPREALKTLLNLGAVENEEFNHNVEMQEAKKLVDDDLIRLEVYAEDLKISAYARLYNIEEIKTWLYTKEIAVPVSIATTDLKIDKNNIIQIPSTYPNVGHMMLIVGWNELGFIVQNSWGEEWGDKGLAILPYEYVIKEAWGVTLTEKQAQEDIKKPSFNIVRQFIMFIIKILSELLKGENKNGTK